MMRPVSDRLVTVEDLYAMPDDDLKHELRAGILVSEPLPGFRHGQVAAALTELLREHVRRRRLGVIVTGDAGYVLARHPDTVRGPDVSFVSRERLERTGRPVGAFPGPPDLAVEVLSPSSTPAAAHSKVAEYLAAGARLVWVVDPEREEVNSYRSLLSPQVLSGENELDGEEIVPGFRVAVAALFQA